MPNKLYISDLDQTLLQSDGRLSPFATRNLNNLIARGINFTAASARSVISQQIILKDLNLKLPVIEFNGSFISDLKTGNHLLINELTDQSLNRAADLFDREGLHYFISTFDGTEDRLHYSTLSNEGEKWYIRDRKEVRDKRLHFTENRREHFIEHVVCLTVINRLPLLEKMATFLVNEEKEIEIHIQENQYTPGWFWLTVHSSQATKDQSIKKLVDLCRLVPCQVTAFGDNTNDIKMLKAADCAIAVSNALPEVKKEADRVIGSNSEDSVVRYIAEDCGIALI